MARLFLLFLAGQKAGRRGKVEEVEGLGFLKLDGKHWQQELGSFQFVEWGLLTIQMFIRMIIQVIIPLAAERRTV